MRHALCIPTWNKFLPPMRPRYKPLRAFVTDPNAIVPEYFAAFSMYVCDHTSACMERSWIVPPPEDQLEVVRLMREYQRHFPLEGFDGVVFTLLNKKDDMELERFLQAIIQLHEAKDTIHSVIEGLF